MRHVFLIGAAALAACAEGEKVDLSDATVNGIPAPATPVENGSRAVPENGASEPVAGGPDQWFERTNQGRRWAGYGPPFSEAAFSVRCEGDRLIFNTTEMPPSGAGATTIHLSATGVDQRLAAESSEEGLPNTEASVRADSAWLTRLASGSGDLTVRVGGSDPLVVPIGDPLTSLIRDCGR